MTAYCPICENDHLTPLQRLEVIETALVALLGEIHQVREDLAAREPDQDDTPSS